MKKDATQHEYISERTKKSLLIGTSGQKLVH